MTNLLGSIRLAAYAFPLIAALVAVPFFDRQVRARCFNWVRTVFGGLFLFYVLCVLALVFFPLPDAATSHGTPTMELSRGNVAADGTTVTLGPQSFVAFSV